MKLSPKFPHVYSLAPQDSQRKLLLKLTINLLKPTSAGLITDCSIWSYLLVH